MFYQFLCEFLPFLIALNIYGHALKKDRKPLSGSAYGMLCIFALYMMGVLLVTGAGTLYNGIYNGLDLESLNLIPFSDGNFSIVGYLLNVILFVPLGFLVPLIFQNKDRLRSVLGLGFAFSLLIELSQILSFRAKDVDDLIMNTLGTAVGFLIFAVFKKYLGERFHGFFVPESGLALAMLIPFLARFFLYCERGFSRWLYSIHP